MSIADQFNAYIERRKKLHAEGEAILTELKECRAEIAAELDKVDAAGNRARSAIDLLGEIPKPR